MNKYFLGMVICAFASVISFFTISSYFADSHHINGVFWVLGFLFGLGGIYFGWRLNETMGGGKEER